MGVHAILETSQSRDVFVKLYNILLTLFFNGTSSDVVTFLWHNDDVVVYWYSFSNHYTKRAFTQP